MAALCGPVDEEPVIPPLVGIDGCRGLRFIYQQVEAALADWSWVKLNPECASCFARASGTLAKSEKFAAFTTPQAA